MVTIPKLPSCGTAGSVAAVDYLLGELVSCIGTLKCKTTAHTHIGPDPGVYPPPPNPPVTNWPTITIGNDKLPTPEPESTASQPSSTETSKTTTSECTTKTVTNSWVSCTPVPTTTSSGTPLYSNSCTTSTSVETGCSATPSSSSTSATTTPSACTIAMKATPFATLTDPIPDTPDTTSTPGGTSTASSSSASSSHVSTTSASGSSSSSPSATPSSTQSISSTSGSSSSSSQATTSSSSSSSSSSVSTRTSSSTSSSASPTTKKTCTGGDGQTYPVSLLNTEGSQSGNLDKFCIAAASHTDWPYKQTFDGEYAGDPKAVMEISTQEGCTPPYDGQISADYCKEYINLLANDCDTDSGNKHGGTVSTDKCYTFSLSVTSESKLSCKGGNGWTWPVDLLNGDSSDSGVIDNFCTNVEANTWDGFHEDYTGEGESDNECTITLNLNDCDGKMKLSHDECVHYVGQIANNCDTDSGDKHGGIFDVGNCLSFNMTMYDPSVVFGSG
ncbi:hypothetical protein N7452_000748 [Penicillium brevicompactum]|uniref:Uncharacterized protein n=1 Tax=Penicillium brevicompactum TaxID=5074 RepID=A0A9W9UPE8_PENBR|nr:hypothetical protein N7452_000748 [Penicillium brevicompactum]